MSDKDKSNAPKKPGEGMVSAVVEEAIEGTAREAGKTIGRRLFEKKAVSAALKIAKIGFFGKAIIAVACAAVIVGCVYLLYSQIPKRGNDPAGNSGGVVAERPAPSLNQAPTSTPAPSPSEAPSQSPSKPAAPSGGIPNAVYIHGSTAGGIKLTFSGTNTLITTFMQDGAEYPFEGTYEIKEGGIIVMTNPDGDVSEHDYSLNGDVLTIDGMDYIREGGSPNQTQSQSAPPEEEPYVPNDPLEGTYIRQGTDGLLSLTFSGNNVTLVTSGLKNMGMTLMDRSVKGTYSISGDYLTFDWEEWQGQNVIIHTAAYSSKGNVLIYDLLEYIRR